MTQTEFTQTPDEIIVKPKGRRFDPSIIFSLRELSQDEIDAAQDKFYATSTPIAVIETDESGMFDVYTVKSGDRYHEVIRFGWFVHCDCPDFMYAGACCKHLVLTLPKVCRKCHKREVSQRGKTCDRCEMDNAIYLKPASDFKPTIIGRIRV